MLLPPYDDGIILFSHLNSFYYENEVFYLKPIPSLLFSSLKLYSQEDTSGTFLVFPGEQPEFYNCSPLVRVQNVAVLNFESNSKLYFTVANPEILNQFEGLFFNVSTSGTSEVEFLPYTFSGTHYEVILEKDKQYEWMCPSTCELPVIGLSVSTIPESPFGLITVNESIGNLILEWRELEAPTSVYDFLTQNESLDQYEVYAFLQNFLKDGELIDDVYMNGQFDSNAFEGNGSDGVPSGDGDTDCKCRVLNMVLTTSVVPTSSAQSNPIILPSVVPTTIITETNRKKLWYAGAFEGPARYQQIWGETAKCVSGTTSGTWGVTSGGAAGGTSGRAITTIFQACKEGGFYQGECLCRQSLTYEYDYDACLDVKSGVRSGWCFESKNAEANVQDIAISLVSKRSVSNISPPEVLHTNATLAGAGSTCERDFVEQNLIDAAKIAVQAYGLYVTGVSIPWPITTNMTTLVDLAYKEYLKSKLKEDIEDLLTQPWVQRNCEEGAACIANDMSGAISIEILNDEIVTAILLSQSGLQVSGKAKWNADARVLSGFRTSLVLNKKDPSSPEGSCCTKPAGAYNYSTFHPTIGANSYKQLVGAHLAQGQLGNSVQISPVNGQVLLGSAERNIFIGDNLLNCETTINDRSMTKSDLSATTKVVMLNENLTISGLDMNKEYIVSVSDIMGRVSIRKEIRGEAQTSFEIPISKSSNFLFITLFDGLNTVTYKILSQ